MCHLFMDQWVSFGDRERSDRALLAELWRVFPPQPNEPALPAVHLRGLSCQSRSSSELHLHAVISAVIWLEWPSGASRTPADAPNFTRGLAVALGGKTPKSWVGHPEFEPQI